MGLLWEGEDGYFCQQHLLGVISSPENLNICYFWGSGWWIQGLRPASHDWTTVIYLFNQDGPGRGTSLALHNIWACSGKLVWTRPFLNVPWKFLIQLAEWDSFLYLSVSQILRYSKRPGNFAKGIFWCKCGVGPGVCVLSDWLLHCEEQVFVLKWSLSHGTFLLSQWLLLLMNIVDVSRVLWFWWSYFVLSLSSKKHS